MPPIVPGELELEEAVFLLRSPADVVDHQTAAGIGSRALVR